MSSERLPTRRELVAGAIGLATGSVGLRAGEAASLAGLPGQQATHEPYRYAGTAWWSNGFTVGGGNPDRGPSTGREAGFEGYYSVQFKRKVDGIADQRKGPVEGTDYQSLLRGTFTLDRVRAAQVPALEEVVEVFNRWAQDMTSWAKAVREDILRIEDHLRLPHGDPGDPPPLPWK